MIAKKVCFISKIGIDIRNSNNKHIILKHLCCKGKIDYEIDFSKEIMEEYILEHQEVRQCTYYKGLWTLEDGKLTGRCLEDGQLYTSKPIGEFSFETGMIPVKGDKFGIIFGAKGSGRHYRLLFENGSLMLIKYNYGDDILCSTELSINHGDCVNIKLIYRDDTILTEIDGKEILKYNSDDKIYGIVGAFVGDGSVVRFDKFRIKEFE